MASLEFLEGAIRENIGKFEELESVEIPASLKSAVKDGWQYKQDILLLKTVQFYDPHQRKKDSQRIIPLNTVLSIIREMEEKLIDHTVLDPLDIYFRTIASKERALVYTINGLGDWRLWWEAIKILWQIVTLGEAGLIKIILHTFEIAAVGTIAVLAEKILVERERITKILRSRALPSPVCRKRFKRRKVSRK